MSSALVSPPVVQSKSLSCPNCGGPVQMRGFAHTLSVVCPQCLTVLDASTPELVILQKFHSKLRLQPLIPLGSRGTLGGKPFEAIGFQRREVRLTKDDPDAFGWNEYVLFNPYQGFRYLSEFNGHWNLIRSVPSLPEITTVAGKKRARYQDQTYLIFDTARAKTVFVLGEFPWQVRVGEAVFVEDYTAPPRMLSAETTDQEVTWSQGEYWDPQQIWQAFQLPGKAASPTGIFLNQPSPYKGKVRSAWSLWFKLMLALAALAVLVAVSAPRQEVFRQHYTFSGSPAPGSTASASTGTPTNTAFVTDPFEVGPSRISNLDVMTRTDLRSNAAYFSYTLVNETTGTARDFGREVSHYGDEGSPNDSVVLPNVPAGKYYLRVEPELQSSSGSSATMSYDLLVLRGVPTYSWLWLAAVLLSIPPIFKGVRAAQFETKRWSESDFSPITLSKGGD